MEVLVQHWQNSLNRWIKQSSMVSSSRNYEVMHTLKEILSKQGKQFVFRDASVHHMNLVGPVKCKIRGENKYPVQYTNISVGLKHKYQDDLHLIAIDLIDFDVLLVYPWAEPGGVYLCRQKIYENQGWSFVPVLYHEWYQLRQKQQKIAYLIKKLQALFPLQSFPTVSVSAK
eukprot:TRINITY_DN1450_c1_g1_i1.p2 TRINITY_DN1450_c1_g1~~TRINITY_DN1450_c1_g1_i1.p2  ORF type:complete len:172 (-),score=11.82 TRINITY_DN1450_c1_g1_i1:303-818(-)